MKKKSKYYTSLIYEKQFKEYSSENDHLEKGIMKIIIENFLMYPLRQTKSQTNIVQSSSSANENLNREILCRQLPENGSCYKIP